MGIGVLSAAPGPLSAQGTSGLLGVKAASPVLPLPHAGPQRCLWDRPLLRVTKEAHWDGRAVLM